MKTILCLCFVLGAIYAAPPQDRKGWVFNNTYTATGVLKLPYAEIEEQFTAWYDADQGKSRIDYYNGMVKTYQRADILGGGESFKIAPMTNEEVTNSVTCFAVNGSVDSPVTVQSVFPDTSGFTYSNDEACGESTCEKWVEVVVVGDKYNKYSFWISKAPVAGLPVRYEMLGYDTLLGSHYDKYVMEYYTYEPVPPDPTVFDIPEELTCGSFPGPGIQRTHLHNPIKEFVDRHDSHLHELFDEFKDEHSKSYNDANEHEMRKNIFRQNLRYIHSKNRKGHTYKLKINHLADRTNDELKVLLGRVPSKGYNGGLPFSKKNLRNVAAPPDSIDWRLYGAVTPVKDQAVCGSCWSFGTIATIEGSYFLKTGQLFRLSEQSLIDCTWGYGNNGCDGGEDFRAYQWILKHGGVPLHDSYGPYLGEDGYCHAFNSTMVATITSYVNITQGDLDALKQALASQGPISVSIDAGLKDFAYYSHGVFYNSECKNGYYDLNHSVLAVGYGTLDGEPYWLLKNSWSTYWGNDGYILMSQRDNMCGVATAATYVNLA